MTISEFISKENLSKENPFANCDVVKRIGINEYIAIASAAEEILFNKETNAYRALFREFAIRISVMTAILGLENDNDDYEIDDAFEVVMCSGIWRRFIKEVAGKVAPDINSLLGGINIYLDDEVEKNRQGTRKLVEEVANTLVTLVESEAFQKMLESIDVSDVDTTENKEE